MARIELKGLSKAYRGSRGEVVPAVQNLDLTIEPGEFLVLMGPSGSGKTTTLRLVAGLEAASSGSVAFDGELMNHRPAHERDVAMVFQRDALYPHMTVYENLSFGLRMRKESNVEDRVRETAAMLGMEPLLGRMPRELSGGQRQRVAVGRAIVRRPAVFLFDEPLTNLDGAMRGQLRREIALLQRQLKVTTLYVTHDQAEAMALGDRIAVLHDGRLQQVSTPLDLYARPANTIVAGMLGSPPMNLLPGKVLPDAAGIELTGLGHMFEGGPLRLRLPDEQRALLNRWQGREVLVGWHPEDVMVRAGDPAGSGDWRGQVQWREWLGNEMIARVAVGGVSFLVRLSVAQPWQTGAVLRVRVEPARLHFFDPASGGRVG
jgi:multiple sugar transport system ATP-binding protein